MQRARKHGTYSWRGEQWRRRSGGSGVGRTKLFKQLGPQIQKERMAERGEKQGVGGAKNTKKEEEISLVNVISHLFC